MIRKPYGEIIKKFKRFYQWIKIFDIATLVLDTNVVKIVLTEAKIRRNPGTHNLIFDMGIYRKFVKDFGKVFFIWSMTKTRFA